MTISAPLPALGPNPTTDEIDGVVHSLIDLHFAGEIDEETTRRQIIGALYASNIHHDVADRRTDLSQQSRIDLAESLLSLLTDKMLNGTFYSLANGRNGSACGWARQVAKAAAQSELRNHRRAAGRNGTPIDPTSHEFSAMANAAPSLAAADLHSHHMASDVTGLVDEFADRTRGMRGVDRIMASSETICIGLGVEPALRPEEMSDRDWCLDALERDETLAYRSLRAWANLVCGSDVAAVGDMDDRLLALWDEQTEDSAEELLSRPTHVTHMLAIAAVSPLPRPPKKALQKLKTVVMAGNGVRDKAWRELASSLVDAWVASEFEAFSQYATMSDTARAAASTGHTINRNRLDTLLDRAAVHPGAPYGRSKKRVLSRINEAASVVFGDEKAAKAVKADKAA